MKIRSWLAIVFVLAIIAGACNGSASDETTTTAAPEATTTSLGTTTQPPVETTAAESGGGTTTTVASGDVEAAGRSVSAPAAVITVDGDPSDWASVAGLATTLEPIVEEADAGIDNHEVVVKFAHDDANVYALLAVDDDYNFDPTDPHLTGSAAFLFPVDTGGPHMGADDEAGENSIGMVDIWHWELECASGVPSGGLVNAPGEGKAGGNDSVCNFDDEWSTDFETREDDDVENSLLGQWSHSNPSDDGAGVWYFEVSRPLDTGDPQDAVFAVGSSTDLALAYWDADNGREGWDPDEHIQSSNQGWIHVNFD